MSHDDLQKFLQAVREDPSLQEKLKSASDADALSAVAKAAGFSISAEELKDAEAHLSDEEMESMAGGCMDQTFVAGTTLACHLLGFKWNWFD